MKNRIIALMMIVAMLMTSGVYAEGTTNIEEITDIVDMEWAEPFIQKVIETDVMPAYSTNEFKPAGYATKMEVINVVYRIALLKGDVTTSSADTYLIKYKETLDAYLIPNVLEPYGPDNHRAIAYALEREILKKSELSLFFVNGQFEVVSKVDASVYMSRAMNIYLKENVNKFYEIQFKDGSEINLLQWPWINLMIEKQIVQGGSDNYFYPNSILSRNILSVLASNVLREIEGFEPGEVEEPTDTAVVLSTSGKISILHYDLNLIEVRDTLSQLHVFDATTAELTMNGESIAIQNLEPNMDVKVTYTGKTLKTLDVVEDLTKVEGILGSVGVKVTVDGEVFRPVSISTSTGYKYYKALNSIVVERDFQTSTLDELQEGDIVEVSYQGENAMKIEAMSPKAVLTGSLQRSAQFDKGDAISIKLSNGKLFEQSLANDVSKFNFTSDLVKGDIVKITIEKGVIKAVEATGLSSEATGRITEIKISSSPSVSIIDNNGTTREFNIASDVVVNNLGAIDTNNIYALRLDYDVTLELSGVEVNKININQSVEKAQFQAEITEIHNNINLIKAKDTDGKVWIVSLEGSDQNILDYAVGDSVFIYGVELSGDLFEADLIIVLE